MTPANSPAPDRKDGEPPRRPDYARRDRRYCANRWYNGLSLEGPCPFAPCSCVPPAPTGPAPVCIACGKTGREMVRGDDGWRCVTDECLRTPAPSADTVEPPAHTCHSSDPTDEAGCVACAPTYQPSITPSQSDSSAAVAIEAPGCPICAHPWAKHDAISGECRECRREWFSDHAAGHPGVCYQIPPGAALGAPSRAALGHADAPTPTDQLFALNEAIELLTPRHHGWELSAHEVTRHARLVALRATLAAQAARLSD